MIFWYVIQGEKRALLKTFPDNIQRYAFIKGWQIYRFDIWTSGSNDFSSLWYIHKLRLTSYNKYNQISKIPKLRKNQDIVWKRNVSVVFFF